MSAGAEGAYPWRAFFTRRARFLVVISAIVTGAGLAGSLHWPLELFSHFVAWYAAGTAVLAAFLFALRERRWATIAAMLCLFQAAGPLSWYLPSARAASGGDTHCRLFLANVLSQNQDTESFLKLVGEVDADVVCVQEVTERWEEALAPLEGEYTVHTAVPRPDNFGIAIYSRLPGPLPEIQNGKDAAASLVLNSTVAGRPLALLNMHAVPPLGGRMAALRRQELQRARAWLDEQSGAAVLMGDLNLTMYSPVYRELVRGSELKNARAGHGPLGTWPAKVPFMRLPLDQCLVQGAEVMDCRTVRIPGSDHLGLVVDLSIPAK